ncbi:hypothetical protein FA95DRAFT_1122418 [Auriscalpium vulgare]|uniref:Uncharacterized protein n=1 Tax=Auriscalpium vulgare TaxID=40419 RepID=A0ACB8R4Y7_9AGAM|nr:hypothetical protein FA95DRAFT_1122418 [Auriscalpium vulgare]
MRRLAHVLQLPCPLVECIANSFYSCPETVYESASLSHWRKSSCSTLERRWLINSFMKTVVKKSLVGPWTTLPIHTESSATRSLRSPSPFCPSPSSLPILMLYIGKCPPSARVISVSSSSRRLLDADDVQHAGGLSTEEGRMDSIGARGLVPRNSQDSPRRRPCPYCGKNLTDLTRHINAVHLGKKPYHCTFPGCGKTFAFSASRHKKTHSFPKATADDSSKGDTAFRTDKEYRRVTTRDCLRTPP